MSPFTSYLTGFSLSVFLTLAAPFLLLLHGYTGHQFPAHGGLYVGLTVLALLQLGVQLYFFLHIGHEPRPRWNLIVLVYALLIVAIIVGGTLWIMNNLQHEQLTAEEIFEHEAVLPPH